MGEDSPGDFEFVCPACDTEVASPEPDEGEEELTCPACESRVSVAAIRALEQANNTGSLDSKTAAVEENDADRQNRESAPQPAIGGEDEDRDATDSTLLGMGVVGGEEESSGGFAEADQPETRAADEEMPKSLDAAVAKREEQLADEDESGTDEESASDDSDATDTDPAIADDDIPEHLAADDSEVNRAIERVEVSEPELDESEAEGDEEAREDDREESEDRDDGGDEESPAGGLGVPSDETEGGTPGAYGIASEVGKEGDDSSVEGESGSLGEGEGSSVTLPAPSSVTSDADEEAESDDASDSSESEEDEGARAGVDTREYDEPPEDSEPELSTDADVPEDVESSEEESAEAEWAQRRTEPGLQSDLRDEPDLDETSAPDEEEGAEFDGEGRSEADSDTGSEDGGDERSDSDRAEPPEIVGDESSQPDGDEGAEFDRDEGSEAEEEGDVPESSPSSLPSPGGDSEPPALADEGEEASEPEEAGGPPPMPETGGGPSDGGAEEEDDSEPEAPASQSVDEIIDDLSVEEQKDESGDEEPDRADASSTDVSSTEEDGGAEIVGVPESEVDATVDGEAGATAPDTGADGSGETADETGRDASGAPGDASRDTSGEADGPSAVVEEDGRGMPTGLLVGLVVLGGLAVATALFVVSGSETDSDGKGRAGADDRAGSESVEPEAKTTGMSEAVASARGIVDEATAIEVESVELQREVASRLLEEGRPVPASRIYDVLWRRDGGPTKHDFAERYLDVLMEAKRFRRARIVALQVVQTEPPGSTFEDYFRNSILEDPALEDREPVALTEDVDAARLGKGSDLDIDGWVVRGQDGEPTAIFDPETSERSRWQDDVAAWRLCELLECQFDIPRTRPARLDRSEFDRLVGDDVSRANLRWRTVEEDGGDETYLYGSLRDWPGDVVRWPIEAFGVWRPWMQVYTSAETLERPAKDALESFRELEGGSYYEEVSAELGEARVADLARQMSGIVSFDYLTNNWGRFAEDESAYGSRNHFADGQFVTIWTDTAFQGRKSTRVKGRFSWISRFSRDFITSVRLLERDLARDVLYPDASALEQERFEIFWEQRTALLERVDELVAEHGRGEVLSFE